MKRWTIDIDIDEHVEVRGTCAEARLHTGDPTNLRGIGTSWRHPRDSEVPEVGDELAVARALTDLAEKLRAAAAGDIEGVSPEASPPDLSMSTRSESSCLDALAWRRVTADPR